MNTMYLKKTRTIGSAIALMLVIPTLAAGCASSKTTPVQPTPSGASQGQPSTNSGSPSPSPAGSGSTSASGSYSASEVAKHATADDCWLIVDGGVYNVTSFVNEHPGGPDRITNFCGKDASAPFHQKPNGQPHSQRASDILKTLQIGTLSK